MGCGLTLALKRASAPLPRPLGMNLSPTKVSSLIFSASKCGMSALEHSDYLHQKSTGAKKQQTPKAKYKKGNLLQEVAKVHHPGCPNGRNL